MKQSLKIYEFDLKGLAVVERTQLQDERGFFSRLYCAEELLAIGLKKPVVQVNHSYNKVKGTVRGMHYQDIPNTESKLVTCIRGEIFDVAVDLRKSSPTFLQWRGERLSADNRRSFFIPDGFAHGYQTLTDDCEIIYMHTNFYAPSSERALNVLDPKIDIKWPMPIAEISSKDRHHKFIDDKFEGVLL